MLDIIWQQWICVICALILLQDVQDALLVLHVFNAKVDFLWIRLTNAKLAIKY
jgi:hypothetical protein